LIVITEQYNDQYRTMSVDKFGRHSRANQSQALRGPKGEGYNLTPDGDYDIKKKRLCYLEDPVNDLDAVNLKTLNSKIQDLKISFNTEAKTQFKKVEDNLKKHVENADKLTKAIEIQGGYISLNKNKRIVGVNKSIDPNDVVIKEELTALEKKIGDKQKKVFDILNPTEQDLHGSLKMKAHRRISQVSRATNPFDVIVKIQFDEAINKVDSDIKNVIKDLQQLKNQVNPILRHEKPENKNIVTLENKILPNELHLPNASQINSDETLTRLRESPGLHNSVNL